MLSIDYLHINAHPYLPPTPLRSGFGYYFHFTPGLGASVFGFAYAVTGRVSLRSLATPSQVRPGLSIELTAPPVGGAQNSARRWLAKVQFIAQRGDSSKMLLIFLFSTKSLGHVWADLGNDGYRPPLIRAKKKKRAPSGALFCKSFGSLPKLTAWGSSC